LETLNLSRGQKIKLRVFGEVSLGMKKRPEWSVPIEVFLVRCKKHGLFEIYRQGDEGKLLCPKCMEDLFIFVSSLKQIVSKMAGSEN